MFYDKTALCEMRRASLQGDPMKFFSLILCLLLLVGCAPKETAPETTAPATAAPPEATTETALPPGTTVPSDPIREIISGMSLQERVGQLFLARCDGATAVEHVSQYQLGGFLLFGQDFENQTPDSFREKLASYQNAAKIPLLVAVDEEGGTVARVSSNTAFRSQKFPSPRTAYSQGGMEGALLNEDEKCSLLASLGINVNLGPVCDITTDPNAFMYQRSMGLSPEETSRFVSDTVAIMNAYRIGSVLKHFPGYGNNADTHTGMAVDSRSLEELEEYDLLPFAAGMGSGCGAILVSHTIVEALDSSLPASLSPAVHTYLREKMGFDGVILTDDLVMQAITDQYGAGEAAVMAVLAGNDLLCSTDYVTQYEAVYAAVLDGRIDIDVLNSAVRNVLEWKAALGLIVP